MNTLQELNNRVFNVVYTDERPASVIFDRITPTNATRTIYEGQPLTIVPGIEILDVANYTSSQPYYEINISYISGAVVEWETIPAGCIVSNPSTGVYRITGVNSKAIWDQVRNPQILFPNNISGTYTYTGKIVYNSTQNKTWTTTLDIINVDLLTQPSTFLYYSGVQNSITGVPQIVDEGYMTPVYTLTVTPSVTSVVSLFSTTGTGGTSSFNSTTKVLTLTGTRDQVNARLNTLKMTTPSSADANITLTYYVSNSASSETDTKVQTVNSYASQYLGPVRGSITYNEDQTKSVNNGPLITDASYADSTGYELRITPNPTGAVSSMSSSGTGGTSTWNNSSKTLVLTGTRAQINARIDALTMVPTPDYASNFTLGYTVYTPRNSIATKSQSMLIGTTNTEITNMDADRDFVPGENNLLFQTDIPQITDTDATVGLTYTCTFSSSSGKFSYPTNWPTTPYTYSGLSSSITLTKTKTQWNSFFDDIKYQPNDGVYLNHTFTYTQYKSNLSTPQSTKTVNMIGPDISFDRETPTNGYIVINENTTHNAFVGIELYLNNYATTTPEYTIDVSELAGVTVTWGTLPAHIDVANPSTGVYVVSGIETTSDWNLIKSPTITLPTNYNGQWDYTSTLTYSGSLEKQWSTNNIVRDVVATNSAIMPSSTWVSSYTTDTMVPIYSAPQIVDTTSGTYSMEIYSDVNHDYAINSLTNTALSSISATHTVSGTSNLISGNGNILVTNNGSSYDVKERNGNTWTTLDTIPSGTYYAISDAGNVIVGVSGSNLRLWERAENAWEQTTDVISSDFSGSFVEVAISGDGDTIAFTINPGDGSRIMQIKHRSSTGWSDDDVLVFVNESGDSHYDMKQFELSYDGSKLFGILNQDSGSIHYPALVFKRSSYAWSLESTLDSYATDVSLSGDGLVAAVSISTTTNIKLYTYDVFSGWVLTKTFADTSTKISLSYYGTMLAAGNSSTSRATVYTKDTQDPEQIGVGWYSLGYFSRSNISDVKFLEDNQTIAVQTTTNLYLYNSDYWPNWDVTTQSLKFSGTKAQVNAFLNSLIYVPYSGFTDNFTMMYIVTNPSGTKALATQSIEQS